MAFLPDSSGQPIPTGLAFLPQPIGRPGGGSKPITSHWIVNKTPLLRLINEVPLLRGLIVEIDVHWCVGSPMKCKFPSSIVFLSTRPEKDRERNFEVARPIGRGRKEAAL